MKRVVNEQPGGFYIVSEELQLRKGQLKDAVSRNWPNGEGHDDWKWDPSNTLTLM